MSQKHSGEPYDLAGNRMVFTNWYYVRPGSFGWYDHEGRKLGLRETFDIDSAEFRRFDQPYGVRLSLQPAERMELTVDSEAAAAEKGYSIGVIIQEGGLYRAWGSGYFESTDGTNWRQPELSKRDFESDSRIGPIDPKPGTVFVDPSAPADERYKGVYLEDAPPEAVEAYKKLRPGDWQDLAVDADYPRVHAVWGTVSADGIRWRKLPVPIVLERSDTQIVAYYDERLAKYVMYTRNYPLGPRTVQVPYESFGLQWTVGRRSIGRSETNDFRAFPPSEVIIEPPPDMLPTEMLYTNCRTTIPGAPDHHLMFPTIWDIADDTTSLAFFSSHNGKVWNYVPGVRLLRTASYGQFDGGCFFAGPNLIELANGDFALPYTGYIFTHKYPRGQYQFLPGYAIWPRGRLIALDAPEYGEFSTVRIVPPGRKLKINAVAKRAGGITVEVADMDYNAVEGRSFAYSDPIIGDRFWTPVTWKGQEDLGHAEGTAIMLRFRLDKAKIFGLEFE